MELPRGMRDLESTELYKIHTIREKFEETASIFGFKMVAEYFYVPLVKISVAPFCGSSYLHTPPNELNFAGMRSNCFDAT